MAYVVVTGAAGALGAAVVRELVARGGRVAAVDTFFNEHGLRVLADELGAACAPLLADVRLPEAWAGVREYMETQLEPPVGAVLAAGGWRGGVPMHDRPGDWPDMLAVNADTVHASLQALLPPMVRAGHGSIVVVGARAVARPEAGAGAAAYAASKAAAIALAQAAAAEVLPFGVRVNAVLPNVLDTPANRAASPASDPSRWVSTASLARVIAFLLSDDAADISGATIPVYGRS